MNIQEEIDALKRKRNALILAHYYVPGDVQAIADVVGDSFYLSQTAARNPDPVLVFAGVSFMGESAKILSPEKTVLLPDAHADCPMAHMVTPEQIADVRRNHKDAAVVCYINSSAELKALSDVCVTSSNALNIIRSLPNSTIYFIPDRNLGSYLAGCLPEKQFILHDGYCPVHQEVTREQVQNAKNAYPDAEVLVHPECPPEVLELADYAGSTAGIIRYAEESSASEFLIGTEEGVLFELNARNPGKSFHMIRPEFLCPGMKQITLEKIRDALKYNTVQVELDPTLRENAWKPLNRMLQLAKR